MTDKIVVLSTCATESDAENLARGLLEARLAACVSIVPGVRSFYHWKGAIDSAVECQLIIKTSRELFPPLRAEIEKLHPYELPELVALPIVEGAENYLLWMEANLRAPEENDADRRLQPGPQPESESDRK